MRFFEPFLRREIVCWARLSCFSAATSGFAALHLAGRSKGVEQGEVSASPPARPNEIPVGELSIAREGNNLVSCSGCVASSLAVPGGVLSIASRFHGTVSTAVPGRGAGNNRRLRKKATQKGHNGQRPQTPDDKKSAVLELLPKQPAALDRIASLNRAKV